MRWYLDQDMPDMETLRKGNIRYFRCFATQWCECDGTNFRIWFADTMFQGGNILLILTIVLPHLQCHGTTCARVSSFLGHGEWHIAHMYSSWMAWHTTFSMCAAKNVGLWWINGPSCVAARTFVTYFGVIALWNARYISWCTMYLHLRVHIFLWDCFNQVYIFVTCLPWII